MVETYAQKTERLIHFNRQVVEAFPTLSLLEGKPMEVDSLPSMGLLDEPDTSVKPEPYDLDRITTVLRQFRLPSDVVATSVGPSLTTTFLRARDIVRLNTMLRSEEEIAFYLKVPSVRIRLETESGLIAVETPNKVRAPIRLRTLMEAIPTEMLDIPAGTSPDGEPIWTDLASFPHALVAGTTGSGKSVFLHSVIISLILRHVPESLRLVLVDAKGGVEFGMYEDLPHVESLTLNAEDTATALYTLEETMYERYAEFKNAEGVRNIGEYRETVGRMPTIVVVVDELASLFDDDRDLGEVQRRVITLAQLGRAAGIHLILATQRPSHDVITGRIKANIPARIAMTTATGIDSRVIMDRTGAERLIGMGDAIFVIPGYGEQRVQTCLVTREEIMRVIDWWKSYPTGLSSTASMG